MRARVGIVDYGRGNLHSVAKALEAVGAEVRVSDSPSSLNACKALLLPGVGAFGAGMRALRRRGLVKILKAAAVEGRPMMGVCLGHQLFCSSSTEYGEHEGLGFFSGRVTRFRAGLKVPHMGWNQVLQAAGCPLFKGLPGEPEFYFDHSYRVRLRDRDDAAGLTRYGADEFDSVLWRGNLFATQFHPEKSQQDGLKLYSNFWRLVKAA